jgi:hypothetical protein
MNPLLDEGFTDEDVSVSGFRGTMGLLSGTGPETVQECEGACSYDHWSSDLILMVSCALELAYQLLASLPRSRLATIQRRLAPLLQFDVVGVSTSAYVFQC